MASQRNPQILLLYPKNELVFKGKDFNRPQTVLTSSCIGDVIGRSNSYSSLGGQSYRGMMFCSVQVRLLRW